MRRKPVIFSDVDGTIYSRDNYVSNSNLSIIKGNDLSFNIATGNPICPKMIKLAKLTNAEFIIGSSGAQIYSTKKFKYIHEVFIEPKIVKIIFELFKKYNVSSAAWSSDIFYVFKEEDMEFLNRIYFKYENFDQFELYTGQKDLLPISKMEVYFENSSNVDELMTELEKLDCQVIKTHMNIEIIPKQTSKGQAILWMLENVFNNNTKDDIMVIGDSENDFSMFKTFNYSYAMDNAKDYVKNEAKFVTKAVTEHGLGLAILDYLSKWNK